MNRNFWTVNFRVHSDIIPGEHLIDVDEYTIFDTKNYAWKFSVDNQKDLIIIENAVDFIKIPFIIEKSLEFNVWEETYDDIIFPGKKEIIHRPTSVRSHNYVNKPRRKLLAHVNDIEETIRDIYSFKNANETSKANVFFDYEYAPGPVSTILMHYQYKIIKALQPDITLSYKPEWPCRKTTNIKEKLELHRIKVGDEINIKNSNMPDSYLVFLKQCPDEVFIVEDYFAACKLIADIKYSSTIPFIGCGIAVWEDYYFMPLMHDNISFTKERKIILSEPKEKLLDLCVKLDAVYANMLMTEMLGKKK